MDTKEIIKQHEKRDDELKDMMRGRFVDYDSNFKAIDKRFENNEVLTKLNGEHLSHLRNDLNITMNEVQEIKKNQQKTNEKIDKLTSQIESLTGKFESHAQIIEPLLQNFNKNKAFWEVLKEWGGKIAIPAGIIASYYLVRDLFK